MKSQFTSPVPEFEFAGFSFPKQVAMLPRGPISKRIERMRNPVCGPYFTSPKPGADGTSFYLESDFMPGLRWQWCDEVSGARIDHTGWFTDEFCDDKIRGIVLRLPHGRGFLAGWSMGENMASGCDYHVYEDEIDAARGADSLAENVAEREREYQESQDHEDDEDSTTPDS